MRFDLDLPVAAIDPAANIFWCRHALTDIASVAIAGEFHRPLSMRHAVDYLRKDFALEITQGT